MYCIHTVVDDLLALHTHLVLLRLLDLRHLEHTVYAHPAGVRGGEESVGMRGVLRVVDCSIRILIYQHT
jgi:hypothetical protein